MNISFQAFSRKIRKTELAVLSIGFFFLAFGFTAKVEAATAIYRSVGPSATAAMSTTTDSSVTLTVSGATATFSAAQPGNMGVGDAIQYDSDNNGSVDSIAFIHGRTSSTVYTVKNAAGSNATSTTAADTDWSVFRAYTSLANAEKGNENDSLDNAVEDFDNWDATGDYTDTDEVGKDIVTADQQWNIALYANGTTPDAVSATWIDGWTTATSTFIKIYTPTSTAEVGTSQRHSGVWDDTKYKIEPSGGTYGIRIQDNFVWIDGIQIKSSAGKGGTSISNDGMANVTISNNIVKGEFSGTDSGATGIVTSTGSGIRIYNNIVYGFINGTNTLYGIRNTSGSSAVYSNTVYSTFNCFVRSAGTVVAINNIAQSCSDGFSGTFTSSNYNISDLAGDAPGANSKNSTTITFVSTSTSDFHLASNDTAAKDAGTSLEADPLGLASFSTDIDGQARVGAWDIGADEIPDVVAPVLSSGAPSGSYAAGTTQLTLSLATSENATCKYGTVASTVYASIANTFSVTGTTTHSQLITGLSNGNSYSYYVRCQDVSGNANTSDYTISFNISQAGLPAISTLGPTGLVDGSWIMDSTPTFTFTTTDTDSTVAYELTVDDSADFLSPVYQAVSAYSPPGAVSTTTSVLPDSASYYWRVRAFDGTATSSYATANSGSIAFKLDTVAPTAGSIVLSNVGTSTIIASSTGTGDGLSGLTTQYLTYAATSTAGNVYSGATSTSWTASGLTPGTQYYFVVGVTDVAGNVATSSIYSTTTLITAPIVESKVATAYTRVPQTIGMQIMGGTSNDVTISIDSVSAQGGKIVLLSQPVASTTDFAYVNYLSPIGFTGTDSFQYRVGNGVATSTGTITITVNAVTGSTWIPPIGIPRPEFGIGETYRMYDTVGNRNPDLTYNLSSTGGYFTHYVDNSVTCTDTNNTYGTRENPRCSVPGTVPKGSVVEIHGGLYTGTVGISGIGTLAQPIFVRGVDYPLFTKFVTRAVRFMAVEGLKTFSIGPSGDYAQNYVAFRNNDVGGSNDTGAGTGGDDSTKSHNHIVYIGNEFHDNGNIANPEDEDYGGLRFGSYTHVSWALENHSHHNSGSGITVSAIASNFPDRITHIYIGRNNIHDVRAAGVWAKNARDLVYSENTIYDIIDTSWSTAKCGGHQYGPERVWFLFNACSDVENGFIVQASSGGQGIYTYVIGNTFKNIHEESEDFDESDPTGTPDLIAGTAIAFRGGVKKYIINNTIYDVDAGISILSSSDSRNRSYIQNNIISTISNYPANYSHHLRIDDRSGPKYGITFSDIDNNILYQPNGGAIKIITDSNYASTTNLAGFQTQWNQCANCFTDDPLFVSTSTSNFNVQSGSVAIDGGDISDAYADFESTYGFPITFDIASTSRPQAGLWDIGAYEFVSGAPDTTPPSISSISSSTTQTTATITWNTNENASSTVDYGLTSSYTAASSSASLATSHSITLRGLTANTVYHYKISVTDAVGNLATSTDRTFVTAAIVTSAPTVTVQSATGVSTSTATLNGTIVSDNNSSSTVRGFEYGLSTSYGSTSSTSGSYGIGLFSASISDLTPNTLYYYRAFATNGSGTGVSSSLTFTTATGPDLTAPFVSALALTNLTDSSISITWNTDEGASSSLIYGTSSGAYTMALADASYVTSHIINLSALSPQTTYYYRIVSSDMAGNTSTSSEATFATAATPVSSGGGGSGGGGGGGGGYVAVTAGVTTQSTSTATTTVATGGVATSSALATGTAGFQFARDLKVGARGADVAALQRYLNANGFIVASAGAGSKGKETDYFGAATQRALGRFQAARGITPAAGFFGAKTRAVVNDAELQSVASASGPAMTTPAVSVPASSVGVSLKLGSRGLLVKQLRTRLRTLGYFEPYGTTGTPASAAVETDYFGSVTEVALRKFQCDRGIVCSGSVASTGWGSTGPKTRAALGI